MSQLTLRWDERLELWKGHADAPGSGGDPAVGPAGPAGVAVLHAGAAVINTCIATGRVTDLYLQADLEQEERDAFAVIVEDSLDEIEARVANPDREPFHLDVRPAAERQGLLRVVELLDALERIDLSTQPVALALGWIELAAALGDMEDRQVPASFLDDGLLGDALRQADRASSQIAASEIPSTARSRVASVLAQLTAACSFAPKSGGQVAIGLLNEFLKLRSLGAAVGRPGGAVLDRIQPNLLEGDEAPTVFSVRPDARRDHLELDHAAAQALRLLPKIGVAHHGPWLTLSCQDDDREDRAPAIWVRAFDERRRLVGASQLVGTTPISVADVAITPGADVVEWEFESNPFRRPKQSVPYGRLDHAAGVSRAAWIAQRAAGANAGLAEILYARSAIAWLYLGQTFRAAWAWSLADQQSVREELAAFRWGPLDAALDAVVESGDIPDEHDPDGPTPVPLWMQAVKITSLVPSLPTRPDSETGEGSGADG